MIHSTADVCPSASVGDGTRIWQFCVVLEGAVIGSGCNICSHCLVEGGALIGNNVTVKCGVQVWDGITLEDDVFVGPNVTFTNDRYPHSQPDSWTLERTIVEMGATIGANATILPGVTIGKSATVAAGSVVLKDVAAGSLVAGNPAVEKKRSTRDSIS